MAVQNSTNNALEPLGLLEGLVLANNAASNTTHLDISPGRAWIRSSTTTLAYVAVLPTTWTKRLDLLWAAGSGNGGRFTGTLSTNQTWHVFLLYNAETGAVDAGCDSSPTAANRPAGWDARYIGSLLTSSSSTAIRLFKQCGDVVYWSFAPTDLNTSDLSTSTTNLLGLTIPTGYRFKAFGTARLTSNGNVSIFIASSLIDTYAVHLQLLGVAGVATISYRAPWSFLTDTQGRMIVYSATTGVTCVINTIGYEYNWRDY